jgi:epoxide hydrolase-like predicted phosphatase
LVTDWGGVLTTALDESMAAFVAADELDGEHLARAMRDLVGEGAEFNPVHALERGEIEVPDFERRLAERLSAISGREVPAAGLLTRMFVWFKSEPTMINVVRRAHARGIRTALLSNSWGNEYPVEDWGDAFDAVVISGQVGMRKPEPEIFQHTLNLVGSKPADAVFVDDTPEHVRAAVELGMIGVHHVSYQQTVEELEAIFGMTLTA